MFQYSSVSLSTREESLGEKPALLTRMSSLPSALVIAATTPWIEDSFETSSGNLWTRISWWISLILDSDSSSSECVRAQRQMAETLHCASCSAMDLPMPRPEPVIRTTFPGWERSDFVGSIAG